MLVSSCTTVEPQSVDRFEPEFQWNLPPGFAPPPVPVSNPITEEKVQLGRNLFYDNRLSVNGRGSCATCHQQHLAFTDGRANAVGVTGEVHPRSSMSLINVAYNASYTWASNDLKTLEQQIAIPLFSQHPVELGLAGREMELLAKLKSDELYASLFERAFNQTDEPVNIENTIKALASFVRTIISADSAIDHLLYLDDQNAISESAMRGMQLFYSERLNCGTCHEGQNFAGGQYDGANLPQQATEFHNTGLYNVNGSNRYPTIDPGLRKESGRSDHDGKFRAPSLRSISVTAPYMHDGSIKTLSDVIDHYAAGGRSIDEGRYAGTGRTNSGKSLLISGFDITGLEQSDLLAFLYSLTDQSALDEARFSNPEPASRSGSTRHSIN